MPVRKTVWTWREKAISYLCTICDQVDITGMETDRLKQPTLGRGEAERMLQDLSRDLDLEWEGMLQMLARSYEKQRNEKAKEYDWYADENEEGWDDYSFEDEIAPARKKVKRRGQLRRTDPLQGTLF